MTEQEVQVLAQKLTRIWSPEEKPVWTFERNFIDLSLRVQSGVHFFCEQVADVFPGLDLSLRRGEDDKHLTGWLSCYSDVGNIHITHFKSYGSKEPFLQFADEWMPFFRRCCWLSGCDIEASAHEKVEWIQGFTREELDAWGLKL